MPMTATTLVDDANRIKADIAAHQTELNSALIARSRAQQAFRDAEQQLSETMRVHQDAHGDDLPGFARATLQELRATADKAAADVRQWENRVAEIEAAIHTLNVKARTAGEGVTVTQTREFMEGLEQQRARVANLDNAIRQQEENLARARVDDSPLVATRSRREDILADIAAGDDRAGDLKAIDAELQELAVALDGESKRAGAAAEDIRATLAGLRRKRDDAARDLEKLERQVATVQTMVVLTVAHNYAEEYMGAARQVVAAALKLQGLARASSGYGERPLALFASDAPELVLPALHPGNLADAAARDLGNFTRLDGRDLIRFGPVLDSSLKAAQREVEVELAAYGLPVR